MGGEKVEGAASWFAVDLDGRSSTPTIRSRWKTNELGKSRLLIATRVVTSKKTLFYIRFFDNFPVFTLSNS